MIIILGEMVLREGETVQCSPRSSTDNLSDSTFMVLVSGVTTWRIEAPVQRPTIEDNPGARNQQETVYSVVPSQPILENLEPLSYHILALTFLAFSLPTMESVSPQPPCRPPNYSHPLSCQEEILISITSLSDCGCQWGQDRRQVWPARSPCPVLVPLLTGAFVTGPLDSHLGAPVQSPPMHCRQGGPKRNNGTGSGRASALRLYLWGILHTGVLRGCQSPKLEMETLLNVVSGKSNSSVWTCSQRRHSHRCHHCQGT